MKKVDKIARDLMANPFAKNFENNIAIRGKDGTPMEDFRKLGMGLRADIDILQFPMGELSYFNVTGTQIAIASQSNGSTNMVAVNPTTTLTVDHQFDNGGANNGRLRYIGTVSRHFHIAITFSFAPDQANDVFVIGCAKNGTVIASSKILYKITSAGVRSTALHASTHMNPGDYLELYVGNTTDGDDFIVNTLNMFAVGMNM